MRRRWRSSTTVSSPTVRTLTSARRNGKRWATGSRGSLSMRLWRVNRIRAAPAAREPTLIDVLKAAAHGAQCDTAAVQELNDRRVRWAVETGLGPLLHGLVPPDSMLERSRAWPLLQGSALAARLESADQLEAASEILDACRSNLPPI